MAPSESIELPGCGVRLVAEDRGEGPAVVLLHGLTATRRYVVMGSRLLERRGHRVLAYDARGHGASEAGESYGYDRLACDLRSVLDAAGIGRAHLVGASMGAHTALALALASPERVAGLVIVTPAYDPDAPLRTDGWDALAAGLASGGVEGFLRAYPLERVPIRWRETVATVIRQRLEAHRDLQAIVKALREVPRSRPFLRWEQLEALTVPTVVVADRDEADPEHPLAVGERYASAIPGARLLVEEQGASPLAWQGSRLSGIVAELVARAQATASGVASDPRASSA